MYGRDTKLFGGRTSVSSAETDNGFEEDCEPGLETENGRGVLEKDGRRGERKTEEQVNRGAETGDVLTRGEEDRAGRERQ